MGNSLQGQYYVYEAVKRAQEGPLPAMAGSGMHELEGFAYLLTVTQSLLIVSILAMMLQDANHIGGSLIVVLLIQLVLLYSLSSI
jgi:hypothetical protein